jgi:hypothetical protein
MHTGKRPGVALIVLSTSDNKYIERVRKISAEYSLGLTIYPIDGGGASVSSSKPRVGGEKEFWLTSSGKSTTVVAGITGRLRVGVIRINRVGIAVRFAGVGSSFQCHQRLSLLSSSLKIRVLQVSHRS